MKLHKVLLIDDRLDLFQDVIDELNQAAIEVVPLAGSDELDEFLKKAETFDAVILDWNFGEASEVAQLCLRKIKDARFVPVLVWTEEPGTFESDLPKISFFPRSCIESVEKSKVNKDTMVDYVNTWFAASTTTNLSDQWRVSGTQAIERSLYELAQLDDKDVIRALRVFVRAGQPEANLDLDHAVEVLARLLQRELVGDSELLSFLREKLKAGEGNEEQPSLKTPSSVLRLHMYYSPNDDFVRTGDIVRLRQGDRERMALVATPSCDLARPRTEFLRLIVIGSALPAGSKIPGDRCELPLLMLEGNNYKNRVANFQEMISLKNLELAKGTNAKDRTSVMLYSHKYESLGGQDAIVSRVTRINDPYRSDLLQKFAAHASRVGVPEFK